MPQGQSEGPAHQPHSDNGNGIPRIHRDAGTIARAKRNDPEAPRLYQIPAGPARGDRESRARFSETPRTRTLIVWMSAARRHLKQPIATPTAKATMARIRTRQLTSMCHRLGIALQAGVDVRGALQREATYGGSSHRYHLAQVAAGVDRGMTMAEAMRRCGAFFPQLTIELVDIGEQTGNLDSVLLRLAEHYQNVTSFRSRFLLGIAWPLLQLVGAICVIGLLILVLGLLGTSSSGVFGLAGPRGLAVYCAIVAAVTMVLLVVGVGLSVVGSGVLRANC